MCDEVETGWWGRGSSYNWFGFGFGYWFRFGSWLGFRSFFLEQLDRLWFCLGGGRFFNWLEPKRLFRLDRLGLSFRFWLGFWFRFKFRFD